MSKVVLVELSFLKIIYFEYQGKIFKKLFFHVFFKFFTGDDPGLSNQKTPTILLLSPNQTFHSFGFSARDFYHDLDQNEARRWFYFDKFKMILHHNKDIGRDTMVKAANGKELPAMLIFSLTLDYFRNHALRELTDATGSKICDQEVRWVITVPAIWRQKAKQFMREAAYQVGLLLFHIFRFRMR